MRVCGYTVDWWDLLIALALAVAIGNSCASWVRRLDEAACTRANADPPARRIPPERIEFRPPSGAIVGYRWHDEQLLRGLTAPLTPQPE